MSELPLHYRVECHNDFKAAAPNSINLRNYVDEFANQTRIADLIAEYCDLIKSEGITLESHERAAALARDLEYERMRAQFPLKHVEYGVLGFGSARIDETDPHFRKAREVIAEFTNRRRAVVTSGGGPGAMDAFMEGTTIGAQRRRERGKPTWDARNRGVTVTLPFEEHVSAFVHVHTHHHTFGPRIAEMVDEAHASYSTIGGMGTDLENATVVQLRQVGHLEDDFLIMLDEEGWKAIHDAKMKAFWTDRDGKIPMISGADKDLATFVRSTDDAVQTLLAHHSNWRSTVFEKLDDESKQLVNQMAHDRFQEGSK